MPDQIQIKSTHGIGAHSGVKILIYGRSGTGKTTLCATAPDPIIFSAEAGLLSLSRFNLPYVEIRSIDDLRNSYRWSRDSTEAKKFGTLCLDSLSEIAEVSLAEAKVSVKDNRLVYNKMIEQMTELIKGFRDIKGHHVYMSAKQESVKNEVTGVIMNGPMMPGSKLGQKLSYEFDEVFQLDIEGSGPNSYRYLRTAPDFQSDAKDRSGMLDPIEKPDLNHIIQKIMHHPPQ